MSESRRGSIASFFVLAIIVYFLIWAAKANKEANIEFDKTHKIQLEEMAQDNRVIRNTLRGHMEPKTDPFVNLVKNGVLELDRSVSVGDALNDYKFFKKTSWKSFVAEQNRRIVEFSAQFDFDKFAGTSIPEAKKSVLSPAMVSKSKQKLNGVEISYVVQFSIAKKDSSFDIAFSALEIEKKGRSDKETFPEKGNSILKPVFFNKPVPTVWLILASNAK